MATVAALGSQTLFQIGNAASPEVFTTMGEVVSLGAIGQRNDLVEVTHMLSTAKEFIGGLPDGLELDVVCNYIPSNTQQTTAYNKVAAGTVANFRWRMPSGLGSLTFTFSALVIGWTVGPITPNEAYQITFSLKISGSIAGPS